jgi:hypothetical protein
MAKGAPSMARELRCYTPSETRETQMHPDAQVALPDSCTFKVHLCLPGYGGE